MASQSVSLGVSPEGGLIVFSILLLGAEQRAALMAAYMAQEARR
ncbi:MAG: hypothetical protein ACREDI_02510 [Roseiarcus sp.]